MYIASPEHSANMDTAAAPGGYAFDEYVVDVGGFKLLRGTTVVALPSRTFDVLLYLIRHRERSVRKDEIISSIWDNVIVTDDSLIHAISVLRRALGDESRQHKYIETIPRRGYRFVGKVQLIEARSNESAPVAKQTTVEELPVIPAGQTGAAGTVDESAATSLPNNKIIQRLLTRTRWVAVILGTVAALLAVVLLQPDSRPLYQPEKTAGASVRLFQPSPPGMSIVSGGVLSPDGRYLAFIARDDVSGHAGIWVRSLQTTDARLVKGTEGASKPFWSPDSVRIGFFASGKLVTSDLYGEERKAIASVSGAAGATWNQDDTILYADWTNGLFAVTASATGEVAPTLLLKRDTQDLAVAWPQFFPDGHRFLYQIVSLDPKREGAYVSDIETRQSIKLLDTASPVTLAPPNYLLHVQRDMLIAEELDPRRPELTGQAFVVARGVSEPSITVEKSVSASAGLLAFNPGIKQQNLVWFDRAGAQLQAQATPTELYNPRLSPDGTRVMASSSVTSNPGLWFTNVEREEFARIETDVMAPIWSPDGRQVAFTSRDGTDLMLRSSDGTGPPQRLMSDEHVKILNDWSADGSHIIYTRQSPKSGFDIWIVDIPTGNTRPLIAGNHNETQARLSPDGKWIAYTSDESGVLEVYVASFPALENRTKVSRGGGGQPQWRADQKELFYLSLDQAIMAAMVEGGQTLAFRAPEQLFRTSIAGAPGGARDNYVVNATGSRFLVDTNVNVSSGPEISILVNWTARFHNNNPDLAVASPLH